MLTLGASPANSVCAILKTTAYTHTHTHTHTHIDRCIECLCNLDGISMHCVNCSVSMCDAHT